MMQPTPGSRIKELREEKFWSMKELAKRVYVTPSQISR
ncbi:MAG: helix-turn-helix transcriptional regulator, partial [Clostridia bacterium]|nr:helix-turn-helix transcriptional regulator [Clostridia bacterium]